MLDLTKKYKTVDGRPVINLRTREDNDIYPLIGHIEGHGSAAWTAKGHYYIDDKKHPLSLIEAKPALLLDLTKPLQTKAQRPVRILSTEGKEPYPIVGYIGDSPRPTAWTQEGKCHNDAPVANLENVPPARHVGYVNVYQDGQAQGYKLKRTREEADQIASPLVNRIACVRIEYTEGQFDD
jgi:hypothetical protein